jgi:hypothetical protein
MRIGVRIAVRSAIDLQLVLRLLSLSRVVDAHVHAFGSSRRVRVGGFRSHAHSAQCVRSSVHGTIESSMNLDLVELECDTAAPLAAIAGLNMRDISIQLGAKPSSQTTRSRRHAAAGYVSLHWQLTAATHSALRGRFCAAFRQDLACASAAHSSADPRSDEGDRHAPRSHPDLSRKRRLTQRSSQCVFVLSGNSTFRAVYATSVSTHR